jgi:predicted secreted hydrolase
MPRRLAALLPLAAMLAACVGQSGHVQADVLAAPETQSFERAYPYHAGPFTFPFDEDRHDDIASIPTDLAGGTHNHSAIEWWYVAGHLQAGDGHRFGLWGAFLRYSKASMLSSELVFGVTDEDSGTFYPMSVNSRALDTSQREGRLNVSLGANRLYQVEGLPFEYQFVLSSQQASADLHLAALDAPMTPNGGHITMGPVSTPYSESWYYVLPHLSVAGTLTVEGRAAEVAGVAVMERQWYYDCTCAANDWDYFNVHLDNGLYFVGYVFYDTENLMTTRWAARVPGEPDAYGDAFGYSVLAHWSPATGIDPMDPRGTYQTLTAKNYSHAWHFEVPDLGLAFDAQPVLDDQEAHRGFLMEDFYKGQARVHGTWRGAPVQGMAFAEVWHDSSKPVPLPIG